MKRSLFILLSILLLTSFTMAQSKEPLNTGLMMTVSGLSEISVDNVFGGIGVQHYFAPKISGRFTVGGTFAEGYAPGYIVSGTGLYDFLRLGQGAFYAGAGVIYSHPSSSEDNYGVYVPLGASFEIFDNVTLGAEYVTTVDFDPTVVTVGGTTGASALLIVWF